MSKIIKITAFFYEKIILSTLFLFFCTNVYSAYWDYTQGCQSHECMCYIGYIDGSFGPSKTSDGKYICYSSESEAIAAGCSFAYCNGGGVVDSECAEGSTTTAGRSVTVSFSCDGTAFEKTYGLVKKCVGGKWSDTTYLTAKTITFSSGICPNKVTKTCTINEMQCSSGGCSPVCGSCSSTPDTSCCTSGAKQNKYTASGCTYSTTTRECCSNGSWSDWGGSCCSGASCCSSSQCWNGNSCANKPAGRICSCDNGICSYRYTCNSGSGWSSSEVCNCNSGYAWNSVLKKCVSANSGGCNKTCGTNEYLTSDCCCEDKYCGVEITPGNTGPCKCFNSGIPNIKI